MSVFNINDLVREAQIRWLKPAEVLFILQNHEHQMIRHEPPQQPGNGALFLFNKRVLRNFRKDGHTWRRKRDGRTVGEAHERLKVGNVEALNCYYAHGDPNHNFQRRSYWILNPAYEHIVLVHYRDILEGRNNANTSQFPPISPSTFSQSPPSYNTQQQGSSTYIGESYEQYPTLSSSGSEISSGVAISTKGVNFKNIGSAEEVHSSSGLQMTQALRRLEEQLSLKDDETVEEITSLYTENEGLRGLENTIPGHTSSAAAQGYNNKDHQQLFGHDGWKEMLDGFNSSEDIQVRDGNKFNENGILHADWEKEPVSVQDDYNWLSFDGIDAQNLPVPGQINDLTHPAYSSGMIAQVSNLDNYTPLFSQGHSEMPLQDNLGITISQKQKFTIREISPEWGYASEATKVFIIGSFLSDPLESAWTCMFGDIEVSAQIIQEGVICCHAPPHLPGKVSIYITSGNRESCSEVREFEYHDKQAVGSNSRQPEIVAGRDQKELLLLCRLVQLLLSIPALERANSSDSGIDLLGESKTGEDLWDQAIDALWFGTSTSSITTDWLLEELLKDKLQNWISSRSQREIDQQGSFLSKKEQGIIHIIAGLGFEWALPPILKAGVNVNFRDIKGWTALHWAARFGREKMIAALIASGASAGAVTDPNAQDPTGKTAASIAASYGHNGLAGYLSEVALTSHLSSLTLEESELSKGSADLEAENTVNSIVRASPITSDDHLSLMDALAAARNAALAAARIQSAFRAHSFRKRQQRDAAASSSYGDEFGISSDDIEAVSAASKLAFRNSRDYNLAALSIQKKYRGWKGRREFLAFRQKVVKIQAHVRGYQVRKNYRVCWAVGILEKVILRWRRHGVGLRGFRSDMESIDEAEEEDILRVFRKQKVDATIDEAVSRVLSMVDSPVARNQYRRLLEKYRKAKADLDGAGSETSSISNSHSQSNLENDDIYQF